MQPASLHRRQRRKTAAKLSLTSAPRDQREGVSRALYLTCFIRLSISASRHACVLGCLRRQVEIEDVCRLIRYAYIRVKGCTTFSRDFDILRERTATGGAFDWHLARTKPERQGHWYKCFFVQAARERKMGWSFFQVLHRDLYRCVRVSAYGYAPTRSALSILRYRKLFFVCTPRAYMCMY